MKKVYTILFGLVGSLLITGCGGGDNNTSATTDENTTVLQSASEIDAEIIKTTALSINNEAIKVNEHTVTTTQKLYSDLNQSLQDMDGMLANMYDMVDKNLETFSLAMSFATKLAKPFQIADDYSSVFTTQEYSSGTPPFAMSQTLGEKYFLMASTTQFFLEGKTIKKYFFDTASLSYGWSILLGEIDKNKDLYLQIVRVGDNGVVTKITSPLLLPATKLLSL